MANKSIRRHTATRSPYEHAAIRVLLPTPWHWMNGEVSHAQTSTSDASATTHDATSPIGTANKLVEKQDYCSAETSRNLAGRKSVDSSPRGLRSETTGRSANRLLDGELMDVYFAIVIVVPVTLFLRTLWS